MDLDTLARLVEAARQGGDAPRAVAACRQAEAAQPKDPGVKRLLFVALLAAAGRRADLPLREPRLNPAAEDVKVAEAELLHGRFAEGWRRYERRLDDPAYARTRVAVALDQVMADVRRWRGEPLPPDGSILVIAEQGLGDVFQFVRYVPQLAGRCPNTTLLVTPNLLGLARAQPSLAAVRVIAPGQPMAKPDRFAMLMSLPNLLGRPEPWAPAAPYLVPGQFPAPRLAGWPGGGIGLAWRGGGGLPGRDLPLDRLAAAVAGCRAVALQAGLSANEMAILDAAGIAHIDGLDDNGPHAFLDTAALIARLDVVITCDTSIAHLAGAMGKPTWVLLPWNSDWRWMIGRADTPWYPRMRLFRQRQMGEWGAVLEEVGAALGDGFRVTVR